MKWMPLYRNVSSVSDIKNAAFVIYEGGEDYLASSISSVIGCGHKVFRNNKEAEEYIGNTKPDIVLIRNDKADPRERGFELCRELRNLGYMGIVVLIAEDILDFVGTSYVTGEGFDNYIIKSDGPVKVMDAIQWAILNRKRRNKHTIQYDENPDFFVTVNAGGKVFDINKGATEGTPYTPRDVVRNSVRITELKTFDFFRRLVQPLITKENAEKVFGHTIEERDSVFQIKTRVHNVPTMGVVATVVKSDITRTMYTRTLDILVNSITMLSHRDNYTAAHSARVYHYCKGIAHVLGHTDNKRFIRVLYLAALLHDVGKIGVRDSILLKPGKLSKKEFSALATHPVKGYKMLKPYGFLRDSLELIRSHHERPDGKGYPDKLKGGKTQQGALIIAVADSFDAMTTDRPYRKTLSYDKAVSEIRNNLGTQFDEEAGRALLSIVTPAMVEEVKELSKKPLDEISKELINVTLK